METPKTKDGKEVDLNMWLWLEVECDYDEFRDIGGTMIVPCRVETILLDENGWQFTGRGREGVWFADLDPVSSASFGHPYDRTILASPEDSSPCERCNKTGEIWPLEENPDNLEATRSPKKCPDCKGTSWEPTS